MQKRINAILSALEYEAGIDLRAFPVRIRETDDALRLEGEVSGIGAKRMALRVVRRAAGTANIQDHLRVRVSRPRPERELMQAVLDALMQERAFTGYTIQDAEAVQEASVEGDRILVGVQDSVVELNGEVGSLSHRRLAEVITWWIPGTADVENLLAVRPAEEESDDEIADVVRMVFDKEPSLDAEQIAVTTREGEVTLQGVVHSQAQKRIAAEDCWYIPGVHAVHNQLQIRPR